MTNIIQQPGGPVLTVEAHDWRDRSKIVSLGMHWGQVEARTERGQKFLIGQFHGIVSPGMIMATRVYQGLRRGMRVKEDENADRRKIVYCWPALNDFMLSGTKWDSTLDKFSAPANSVFAVVVSPNDQNDQYPDIAGWLEHWSWIDACPKDASAPLGNGSRYDNVLHKEG